jgi:guanylate kinase
MSTATGTLFVVAAPSGGGKTSLTRALLDKDPGIRLSVSYTTRPPRPGEQEGVDYHFVSTERFMALRDAAEFLEHAHVHGNWYATSASWLKQQIEAGQDVLLEIDVQGALQVRFQYPDALMIFVMPPDEASLLQRLRERGRESEDALQKRFRGARREIWMAKGSRAFDDMVINDDVGRAVAEISRLIRHKKSPGGF